MMKKVLIIFISCVGILWVGITYISYQRNKEIHDLVRQGNDLVQKVEAYKKAHYKIPQCLEDMRLNLPDDCPLNYNVTRDSVNYVISFQTGLWFNSTFFQSKAYYSDSKEWIDIR